MVHGMSHDHRYFAAQTPVFEARYRILLIDLPGHGGAADAPGPFGPEEFAGGVLSLLDASKADDLRFWGTHTGAGVGLLLASRQPDRFHSLVLEGPVIPGAPPAYVNTRLQEVRRIAKARGLDAALEDWLEESAWFDVIREDPDRCRAAEHREMVMDFAGGPWLGDDPARPLEFHLDVLSGLPMPVLLINGERDHPDFLAVSERLGSLLPRAERVIIPGAGGFPTWEFPDLVNRRVAEFLGPDPWPVGSRI